VPSLAVIPRESGYAVRCGFAIYHWYSGILDHPLSRVMTAVSVVRRDAHRSRERASLVSTLSEDVLMLALEPANMLLAVKLKPDPVDQIKLGFEEIDVMLLVLH